VRKGSRGSRRDRASARCYQALLDRVLAAVDADETAGPDLRAADLSLRLALPDLPLVVNVVSSDDPDHHLRWWFGDEVDWQPELELTMSSAVANAYLQGRENLPIAIAHHRATARGGAHASLRSLPALELLVEPYRRAVRTLMPRLVLA
jgi:hypothetical protein